MAKSVAIVAPADSFEMPVAFQRDDLRMREKGDRGIVFDPANDHAVVKWCDVCCHN